MSYNNIINYNYNYNYNYILVAGPPQITSEVVEVVGVMGQQVEVVAEFCSDPGPIRNTWAWDEVVLPSGNQYQGEHPGTVRGLQTLISTRITKIWPSI